MDGVTLYGAEDVRRAGQQIDQAADTMLQAANTIQEALRQQQVFLDGWLERFREVQAEGAISPVTEEIARLVNENRQLNESLTRCQEDNTSLVLANRELAAGRPK